MHKSFVFFLFAAPVAMFACRLGEKQKDPDRPQVQGSKIIIADTSIDCRIIYDEYGLDGMFILFDPVKNSYAYYNKSLLNQPATPASTFNIVTALVALEEGICETDSSIIKWNGTISRNPQANKDIPLVFAFQNNIDWAFWELRKKIGNERMNYWLEKMQYANLALPTELDSMKMSSHGKDMFWVVSPELRITPAQQLKFIQKLFSRQLPFSEKNTETVKKMMYQKDIHGYKIFGKRGSYKLVGENKYIGWFAGFAIKGTDTRFFVNYIQTSDLDHPKIVDAQKEIAYRILEKYGILDP